MFAKAFQNTALAIGVFLGSSHRGTQDSDRLFACEAPPTSLNYSAGLDCLNTPAPPLLSDEASERVRLQSFIDIFNSMIPVGSYAGHPRCEVWEKLRNDLICGVSRDQIDNLERIKEQLVLETAPICLVLTKQMLGGLDGARVTEVPEIKPACGQGSDGDLAEFRRAPLFIEVNWHGIPYRARLNELMMVDGFVIDGILVSLAQPLTVDTRADLLGDLTDLVGRIRPSFCDVLDVSATSGISLDFSWNGGRYKASALGIRASQFSPLST